MCEGLVKLSEQERQKGESKAFVEAAENVAESLHVSIQEACKILKKDYETYLKIKETL
jgi:2-hydroxy-3-keto-5-methylthiopentenyl-1-phosphate phosphatase